MPINEEQLVLDIVNLKTGIADIKDTMVDKTDYRHMLGLIEGIASDTKTIKEDHSVAIAWLTRLQGNIDRQEREIQAIKQRLQMA